MKQESANSKVGMSQWGRDEMNLVELAFGPITAAGAKTFDVSRTVYDSILKRQVVRRTIITGSDAFGLPKPIDDQVLVGMKALTYEAAFSSRRVHFSRYQLCRTIGWPTDGRAYKRLEHSLNRIAGTTLQFKDAWYDKGESEFKSKTFHLIEEVELCSRDRLDRTRKQGQRSDQPLCHFVWNEVVWKSFEDGYIRKLDMDLFRKIASGRRREVPIRLYRILDKRFYKTSTVRLDLNALAVGTLGLSPNYSPSQLKRIIDRAANWLVECGFLNDYYHPKATSHPTSTIVFRRNRGRARSPGYVKRAPSPDSQPSPSQGNHGTKWFAKQSPKQLAEWEATALQQDFGSSLERQMIQTKRASGEPIANGGAIRQNFVWQYWREKVAGHSHTSPSTKKRNWT